jgi:hypothetical protein
MAIPKEPTKGAAAKKTIDADLATVHRGDQSEMYATDHTPGNDASLRHVPYACNKCHRGTIYRARFHRSFDTSGKSGLATYTHARPGFDGLPKDCREISPQFAKRVFAMAFRERHKATACAKATGTAVTRRPFAPAHQKALGQLMPIFRRRSNQAL